MTESANAYLSTIERHICPYEKPDEKKEKGK